MTSDWYSGTCVKCKRPAGATLELKNDGRDVPSTPPAVIGVLCRCTKPPTNVILTLRGGEASAPADS